MQVLTC